MRPVIVLLALLFMVVAAGEVSAGQLAPDAGVRACLSPSDADQMRCDAFFRGQAERRQIWLMSMVVSCRDRPLDKSDIADFVVYLRAHGGNDHSLDTYIESRKDALPCESRLGFWTNTDLLGRCQSSHAVDSPCLYYLENLVWATAVEMRLRGIYLFCPKGAGSSEQRLLGTPTAKLVAAYSKWLAANPWKKLDSAASGFIDAMAMAYPCGDSERRFVISVD